MITTDMELAASMAQLKNGTLEQKLETGANLCRVKRYHVLEFQSVIPDLVAIAANKAENPKVRILAVAAIKNAMKQDVDPGKENIRKLAFALLQEFECMRFRTVTHMLFQLYRISGYKYERDTVQPPKRLEKTERVAPARAMQVVRA